MSFKSLTGCSYIYYGRENRGVKLRDEIRRMRENDWTELEMENYSNETHNTDLRIWIFLETRKLTEFEQTHERQNAKFSRNIMTIKK